ncbi:toxin HicA [Rhodococcus phenolicus]|uniref:toxin HicA n=1 Tax=Rhodococcus phenolicus TaxID=263849 RepID=UPI00082D3E43|nr:toxin HicA [Rhodococcus phenolicus]
MTKVDKIRAAIARNPQAVRYDDLHRLCVEVFGQPRQAGTSHAVFRTPWPGDPRVNIQRGKHGEAKPYQVKQVLAAIKKMEEES